MGVGIAERIARRLALLAAAAGAIAVVSAGGGAASASAAPTWLPPTQLDAGTPPALVPQVAMDAAGDAVAVWEVLEPTFHRTMASARPAGGAWGAPVDLASPGLQAVDSRVAIDAAGEAMVVWGGEGGEEVIQAATWSPGHPWSGPLTLSSPMVESFGPVVATDPAGDFVVAWEEVGALTDGIVADTRSAAGAWGSPTAVSTAFESSQSPDVAADDGGDATIVWQAGAGKLIQAASRIHGGSWQSPVTLSEAGHQVYEARVAMAPSGEAVAIWARSNGSFFVVQGATMVPGVGWAHSVNLSSSASGGAHVALDAAGEAVAVWGRSAPTFAVESSSRPAGAVWGEPTTISTPGTLATAPSVAVDPAGQTVAVWTAGNGATERPAAAVRKGGAWGAPVALGSPGGSGQLPSVAVDEGGDAVAAWGVEAAKVEVAGFDGAGPRLSGLSIPTSGEAGTPLSFSVKATDVWSSLQEPVWQFGDSTIVKGYAVTHGFLKGGNYPVSVTVTDAVGNSTTATGSVTVTPATSPTGAKQGLARAQRTALVRKGRAALKLHCGGGECAGVLKLYAPPPRGGPRRRRRPVLAGEGSFRIASGGHGVVKVKVRGNVLARLRRAPTGHLVTTLRGTDIAPAKVTLNETKRKHVRRHR